MTNLTNFGKILRKHRIDGNLKQQDLAAELDVSPAYLSALETGRKPIRARLLDKIIDYMALSPKQVDELIRAASELQHDVIIKPINNEQREVALMFALKLQNKNLDTEKLLDFLKSN